ncbi:MAG: DUF933 domain-containing protein [Ignavibacteria bacterium]|nr:DUF933 domain-containing protein [Ignavibacteria bacterium]
MKIGIVGLPFSGKTTFFKSIVIRQRLSTEENHRHKSVAAIINVPDERLDFIEKTLNLPIKINATLEIDDFMGSSNPEIQTYNSKFSIQAKLYDCYILVVRGFIDDRVPHILNTIDIERDIKLFQEDITLFDLSFLENRLEKIEKEIQRAKNKSELQKEKSILSYWHKSLENGLPLRELVLSKEEELLQRNYLLLTMKPLLIAINLSDCDIGSSQDRINYLRQKFKGGKVNIEPFFAKIEMELSELPEEDRKVYMNEFGIQDSALTRLLRSAYNLLGLETFFTMKENECRAWTIKKGATVHEAAGVIHTDFYSKFIRAEVIHFEDFKTYKSISKCKEKGVVHLEGKEYIVQDGDIIYIRHN